jgi:hypothetical protein
MIAIRTFLRNADGGFTLVEDCAEPPSDPDYIEGAIELIVDGVEIIGKSQWDYVDQLWSYVVSMAEKLKGDSRADTYFPDQPILLAFQKERGRVLVSAKVQEGVRRASADEGELMDALRVAGRVFFGKLSELVPSNAPSYRMDLAKLK